MPGGKHFLRTVNSFVPFLLAQETQFVSIKNKLLWQNETAVSAGLMKIEENLREDQKNKTVNKLPAYMEAVNKTQFYGIFEEIFLQA